MKYFTLILSLMGILVFSGCGEAESSSGSTQDSRIINSFGNNGFISYHGNDLTYENLQSLAVDAQDNIYACGVSQNDIVTVSDKIVLVKYTANGKVYANYAKNGLFYSDTRTGYDRGYDLAIDTNSSVDNIIITGTSQNLNADAKNSMTLWRLDRFGKEKSSFGNNGVILDPLNLFQSSGEQIILDKEHNIFVLGTTYNWFHTKPFIWKLDKNGVLDTKFGNGNGGSGLISISFDSIYGDIEYGKMAIDKDGNIIFAGTVVQDDGSHIVILKYTKQGKLDSSFGVNGIHFDPYAFTECAQDSKGVEAVSLSKNKKIIVIGGRCYDGKMDMIAWKYDENGSSDKYFGDRTGKLIMTAEKDNRIVWRDVIVDNSDNIIITGDTYNFSTSPHGQYMSLWKLSHNGHPRSDFGNNGKILDTHNGCYGKKIVFDSNRNLVIGGNCEGFAIWKYQN